MENLNSLYTPDTLPDMHNVILSVPKIPVDLEAGNEKDRSYEERKGRDRTHLSQHLVLILQSGEPLLQLRILLLQILHLRLQIIQISLLPLPCLLS